MTFFKSSTIGHNYLVGLLEDLHMSVGVMKDNKREVSECDGYVCDLELESIDTPSICNVIHSVVALTRMWSTLDLSCEEKTE